MSTHITNEHKRAFEALRNGNITNFALYSCTVGGEPTAAIVSVNEINGEFLITPLFVAVTPNMILLNHDGDAPVCDSASWETKA